MINHNMLNFSGGGGNSPRTSHSTGDVSLDGVVLGRSLIELAGCSQDGVPISAVVKFIKWAYNYEQWEIYEQLVELLITHIKVIKCTLFLVKNGYDVITDLYNTPAF